MRKKKKPSKQLKLFKRAINAKWAFYWTKFLLATSEIFRKHQKLVTENEGTDHEYQHYSCKGCPYQVKDFGETKLTGCILSTPDGWDEPKQAGYIIRTTIQHMAKGGADHGKG